MQFYQLTKDELFKQLNTNEKGLSWTEAAARLIQYWPNVLEEKHKVSPWTILFAQFKSPLIIILMIATAISMSVGHIADGIIVLIIILLNAIFGFVQEYKAEKSMESLKKMMSLKSKVVRDGEQVLLDSSQVVPGDLVVIDEWDKIPADGYLIFESNLETAEAALTGESLPIKKNLLVIDHDVVLGDQKNMLFSGTTITQWYGKYIVTATGMQTQLWSIATMIDNGEIKVTHLQKRLEKLSKTLWIVVMIICVVIFCAYYFGNDLDLTTSFLAAIALAVAAIPEWLPAVVTISLGLWVNRMVKKNALMRKLPSVETLWSVTTICSDKTGTLTKNEMTVTQVFVDGQVVAVSGSGYSPEGEFATVTPSLNQLLTIWLLCNHAHLHENTVIWDPTEWCLIVSALKWWIKQDVIQKSYIYRDEVPFDSSRKMMSVLYDYDGGCTIMVKGAPEMLLANCTSILDNWVVRPLTSEDRKNIDEHNSIFAQHALRVLWFAYKTTTHCDETVKETAETDLIFVWLQWIIDPPRMEVKTAIETCHWAWIQVIMITGDNIQTAQAIAKQLGIVGEAMQWSELAVISDEELIKIIDRYKIFARVNPEHKQRLIKLFKKQWHVVAMTWDGVNDAPALKQADIGIAMGITWTDVSKEASDMILLDDNFTTIIGAIEEWRGIYDNIKKFVNFLLSTNLSEVLIIFITSLFGLPLPLIAIQLLRVNLVTDWLPALALGVDPIDKNIMKRKPLDPNSGIIWSDMFISIIVISLLMTAAVLFFYMRWYQVDLVMARTWVLILLVMLEVMRVQMIRSNYGVGIFANKRLIGAILLSLLLILLVIYTPLSAYFQTKPLSLGMREDIIGLFIITTVVWLSLDYVIDRWLLKNSYTANKA
jgi:P-type Ca2+ transporter type 2C